MRGQNTFEILAILDEAKDMALDVLGAAVASQSTDLLHGGKRKERFLKEAAKQRAPKEEKRQAMRRFYAMVSYLEQDGLVHKQIISASITVRITPKGKRKLEDLGETLANALPPCEYQEKKNRILGKGALTIITFDVPEKYRAKRDWIRSALRSMDFSIIHRSVWMGKGGVPESFLEDLRDLEMGDFVEIFQINKAGSLRRLG